MNLRVLAVGTLAAGSELAIRAAGIGIAAFRRHLRNCREPLVFFLPRRYVRGAQASTAVGRGLCGGPSAQRGGPMRALSRDTASLFIALAVSALALPAAVGAAVVRTAPVGRGIERAAQCGRSSWGTSARARTTPGRAAAAGRGLSAVALPGHTTHLTVASATLDLGPEAVDRWTTITGEPLRPRALAALNAGMTNVTAGPAGVHFLPHPLCLPDKL